jgi:hypothetical protein
MDKQAQEALRNEFLTIARISGKLTEVEVKQYWHFYRHGNDSASPFLVISKPGRRVIHLKGIKPAHTLWTTPPDVRHVGHPGGCYEIRLKGDASQVRAAFNEGFAKLINHL